MSGNAKKLRSQGWFGGTGKNAMMHRSWMKNEGMPADAFDGRPVIGICNTWSELRPATRIFATSLSTSAAACWRRAAFRWSSQ